MNLEARMHQSITRRSSNIILRSELAHLGSETQVSHVIKILIDKGELVRISRGVFLNTRLVKGRQNAWSDENVKAITKELLEKFNLTPLGNIFPTKPSRTIEDNILIEVENLRINKTFTVFGKTIRFFSNKKRITANSKNARCRANSVANQVVKMARQFGLSYADNPMDTFAESVTRLAGDDVKSDPIKDLIIALKRAGKISKRDVANLMAGYIKESRHEL